MIDAEFLKLLRCPIDPDRQAALVQTDDFHLDCARCPVRFPIRDGFPVLVADEAEKPAVLPCGGR